MTTKTEAATYRDEAIADLRTTYPPGARVTTLIRHVSSSGMSRSISVLAAEADGTVTDRSWQVARALDRKLDHRWEGVKIGGCGMDMAFALTYELSRVLYPDGFDCIGDGSPDRFAGCPSNDHSNGDGDYTPHRHSDGGYALRQRTI